MTTLLAVNRVEPGLGVPWDVHRRRADRLHASTVPPNTLIPGPPSFVTTTVQSGPSEKKLVVSAPDDAFAPVIGQLNAPRRGGDKLRRDTRPNPGRSSLRAFTRQAV